MSVTFEDPTEDPSYRRFIVTCARDCRCCSECSDVPCAGTMAGGICDSMCHCREDDDGYRYGDDEDDE